MSKTYYCTQLGTMLSHLSEDRPDFLHPTAKSTVPCFSSVGFRNTGFPLVPHKAVAKQLYIFLPVTENNIPTVAIIDK
jgi:hypothetical protein